MNYQGCWYCFFHRAFIIFFIFLFLNRKKWACLVSFFEKTISKNPFFKKKIFFSCFCLKENIEIKTENKKKQYHTVLYTIKTQKKKKNWRRSTCNLDSRLARTIPGMMPLTPPPSMLSTVTYFPAVGGGLFKLPIESEEYSNSTSLSLYISMCLRSSLELAVSKSLAYDNAFVAQIYK